ncbi:MAG TPA: flagellar biosynthesis protein FlhB [Armatimonadota bacterium]|nr:flagellar biosynthesis protein FlhB [Armatimonadota bacterium]
MAGERTEAATPKRRQDARRRGQVARSQDLTAALSLAAGLGALFAGRGLLWGSLERGMRLAFADLAHSDLVMQSLSSWMTPIVQQGFIAMAPVCLVAAGAGVLAQVAQVGPLISSQGLQFDANRINPLAGIKRMVTRRTAMEVAKGLGKCTLIGYMIYRWILRDKESLISLGAMPAAQSVDTFVSLCAQLAMRICLLFFILGVADYFYQRREHEQSLRMTRQEVKEEFREQDGDPQLKARVRSIQRQMAQHRMMQDVPTADVVVTNPTRIAVALKYDPERAPAPIVVAKGQRLLAQRIREIAREHGVPIVENRPLARSLYRSVPVGKMIPEQLYRAAAELLALIYRTYGRRR